MTDMTETKTKPKPILMSAWSVRRILASAKTETRRVATEDRHCNEIRWVENVPTIGGEPDATYTGWAKGYPEDQGPSMAIPLDCPYQEGQRLYVREPVYRGEDGKAYYEADDERVLVSGNAEPAYVETQWHVEWPEQWQIERAPSMFFPKLWSRILLEVTGVAVERLQEIDCDDAIAEGIAEVPIPTTRFREKWNDLHGDGSWEDNPWVWVIRFNVIHPELN